MKNENSTSVNCIVKCDVLKLNLLVKEPEVKTERIYFVVYKTTNTLKEENEERMFYVGKHTQYDSLDFDGYYGSGTILENSIKKYGKENFHRDILEICSSEHELNCREIYWITATSANCLIYPNCGGMNMTNGGGGGDTLSNHPNREEIVKHFSEINKGEKNHFYGRSHTEETKEKISKFKTGTKPTEEQIEKFKNNIAGKYVGENNKLYGVEWEIERREKQSIYEYKLSNKENFYVYFSKNEQKLIKSKFSRNKSNNVVYNDVTIFRFLKEGKDLSKTPLGKHKSEECKEKLRNLNKDKTQSNEIKEKISKSMMGEKNHFYGRKHSEESKKRMSESKKGKPSKNKGKKQSEESKMKQSEMKKGKYSGYKNPSSLYFYFILNDDIDYWTHFSKNERNYIIEKFNDKKTDTITYKGFIIKRIIKDEFDGTN